MIGDISLMICTPAYGGMVTTGYCRSVTELQRALAYFDVECSLNIVDGLSILPMARNLLVDDFLESQATHLLFIDSDMIFRADDIIKMLDYADAEVVAGLYPKKTLNWMGLSQTDLEQISKNALVNEIPLLLADFRGMFKISSHEGMTIDLEFPFEVEAVPTGLMLVSRECFERLRMFGTPRVYTRLRRDGEGNNKEVTVYFDNEISESYYVGEDFTFCKRVRASGGRVLACPWFVTSHVGQFAFVGDLGAISNYRGMLD